MRRNVIIAVAAAVAVVLLFWFFLIKPKGADIRDVNNKIEEARTTERQLRLSLQRLEEARRSTTATQAKLAKFQLLLPPTPDLPTFIRQVQAAANADGIELRSIAPSPPAPLGGAAAASGIQEISVNLQVIGGFFRMESFLARLEDLQRVLEVRSISLAPTTDKITGEFTLQSTITLTMYVVAPGARASAVRTQTRSTPRATASPTASPSPRSTS